MKQVIETTQLEFDKSSFLIDLVKHSSGRLYIELVQVIHDHPDDKQTIKINPSIVSDLLKVLQTYQAKLPQSSNRRTIHLRDEDQQKIIDRYLKGVAVQDIALQFEQSEDLIRMVLRNKEIPVDKIEAPKKKRRFK